MVELGRQVSGRGASLKRHIKFVVRYALLHRDGLWLRRPARLLRCGLGRYNVVATFGSAELADKGASINF